jgi:hypothetical protein
LEFGHVVLDLEYLDRIYLNAYVPGCRSVARWSRFSAIIATSHSFAGVDSADL